MCQPTISRIRRYGNFEPSRQHDRAVAIDGRRRHVSGSRSVELLVDLLDPKIVGDEHYRVAEQVRETIAHYKELQDIISLLGIEELSTRDRLIVTRARRLQRFLTQPFAVTEAFTGKSGRSVPLVETLKGCRAILDGVSDKWAESSLYMIGKIDEARDKENTSNRATKPS